MLENLLHTCWTYVGGETGALLLNFMAFFADAFVPFVPHVLIVLTFSMNPTPEFGVLLLGVTAFGEISGNFSFYMICKRFGVPGWAKRLMHKYTDFLFIKGEKLILVNRFIPMMPLVAPFIAACGWSIRKSLAYIGIGSVIKSGMLLVVVGVLNYAFEPGLAQWLSLGALLLIIVISALYSRQRRMKPVDAVEG